MQTLNYNNHNYHLQRYPTTDDQSLRAWSNAEILATNYLFEQQLQSSQIVLCNDRFGVWNCLLNGQTHQQNNGFKQIKTVVTYTSQQKAITQNLLANNLNDTIDVISPLETLKNVEVALIKVPKSLELFELFLAQVHKGATADTQVICCFMTKYFANSLLKIAACYFDEIEQSQAWKKARLLILKKPKSHVDYGSFINQITFNQTNYQQYFGVFSADKIDIGTQFLLQQFDGINLMVKNKENKILDLACGNGVIAKTLSAQNPNAEFTLTDDFNLAVESAKLNLAGINAKYLWDDSLDKIENDYFDLVVSNPPFHFEHENNIEVSLGLFKQVRRVLKNGGRFILVANKHLSYDTHLLPIFKQVHLVAYNKKFAVYECS
ncbi:methyltransferase [Psychrobacter sp. HD31]|uniref:class I SAM-dependent methyltransferase n=1 Tax=Psychrobacter sp. HD31 TaxID=3112003 RepID=UPI003DA24C5E